MVGCLQQNWGVRSRRTPALEGRIPYSDSFGFVPLEVSLDFGDGTIESVDSVQSTIKGLRKITNPDGYIYPPIVHTRRGWPEIKSKKIPSSDRCAFLYRLPATHILTLSGEHDDQIAQRYGDAGFLIHFFGLVYGWRCQFHDWWIDGRSKASSNADYHTPRKTYVESCMRGALARFRNWRAIEKMVAINAMFLHGRIWSYESEWERFQAAYQVTDAVFALARDTGRLSSRRTPPHAERILALCDDLHLHYDGEKVTYLVDLRNDLLHQALWVSGMPGHASGDQQSFYASMWLEKFSRRAFFAVCGLGGDYLRSPWWGLGSHYFDVQPTGDVAV